MWSHLKVQKLKHSLCAGEEIIGLLCLLCYKNVDTGKYNTQWRYFRRNHVRKPLLYVRQAINANINAERMSGSIMGLYWFALLCR